VNVAAGNASGLFCCGGVCGAGWACGVVIPINVSEHRAQTNINRVIVRIVPDCITSRSVLELAVLIETPVVVVAVLRLL
jgi:hypothetical protein